MPHTDHPVNDFATALGVDGQLIDVRQPDEVAEGTLPGAVNIPLGELPDRVGELDPGRRVVLLCRSGGRSTQAANFLTAAGFGDVVNLEGGMLAYEG
ncbi:MAG: rhodanese-like domain-containing protein [Acidimicrobiales bacterium]